MIKTRCKVCGTYAAEISCHICKTPRPGFERGVGRPPLYDEAMKPYNVRLDQTTVRYYKSRKLGNGNLSKGIRKGAKR
jgi:hypothetical protein